MTADLELIRRAAAAAWQAEAKLLIDLPPKTRFIREGKAGHGVYTVVRNANDPKQDIEVRHAAGFKMNLEPWEMVLPIDTPNG
jgi:hypothetical protein